MKINRYNVLPFITTVLLFVSPFFWFKPGEMDLGGDSSRLYFYDPLHYLTSQALYSISHSGLGGEGLNYFGIPFFLLLAGFKSIFLSPTLLISFVHGFSLSVAFLSCYLVVKQLLVPDEEKITKRITVIIEICAVIAGLYYVSAPSSIVIWNHMLSTDNQIFLNPLIFFLLLRFLLTHNMRYLLVVLGITFLFAANFSNIGAPAFFAFYPLAFLFLVLYMVLVVGKPLPWKGIAIGVVLFFLLHAFHLVSQIESLLRPGSPLHNAVFSKVAKLDAGLGYFNALASGIKPSISLLGLQQMAPLNFSSFVSIIFPIIFILGLIWNRRKSILLTGIFFLISFFFVTANITAIGLNFYKLLFHIPGFSMFRIFFGQWEWVYLFFYTLLLGQTLSVVLARIKKWQGISLALFLIGFLVIIFWPFISGKTLQYTHWQSKDVSAIVVMDPKYEEVLSYLRSLPIDGKILSLPLTDPGYQVIKGENDAAYEGPSTITYLAGRNEFMGFVEFESFGPSFLQAVKERDYVAIRDILSMLNIRYIYYNEDPYIYGKNFPGQPYIYVSRFFPDTQKGYKEFIKNLGVKEIKTIASKYHIYELDDHTYSPHIYPAGRTAYWSDYLINLHTPLSFYTDDKKIAFYDAMNIFKNYKNIFDDVFLKAQNKSPIFDFFKKKKLNNFVSPTVSQKLSSPIYPLAVLREKKDLERFIAIDDNYIDRNIYFAEKRINELTKWSSEIPLEGKVKSTSSLGSVWKEPKLWDLLKYKKYNSWETTLVRYQLAMEKLVNILEDTNEADYSTVTNNTNKIELKSILLLHKDRLRRIIIKDETKSTEEKKYLLRLVEGMFLDILAKLNLSLPDYKNVPYEVGKPFGDGTYEVYLNKKDVKNLHVEDIGIIINGKKLTPIPSEKSEWLRFEDVKVTKKHTLPMTLTIQKEPNLIEETRWETLEKNEIGTDSAMLATSYDFLGDQTGLVREITSWNPESMYIISFDYHSGNDNFLFSVFERGGAKKSPQINSVYRESLRSQQWKKFVAVFISGKDAKSAFIQINKNQEDIQDLDIKKAKKIEIKKLSVIRFPDPQIVLKKVMKPKKSQIPQITFTRINPTKYKVDVRGAKDPYALVLSQKFNQKWKLFISGEDNDAKTMRGVFARASGSILRGIMQTINKKNVDDQNAKITKSYANGSLNEGVHQDSFLDADTFETWGKDPIAERTHLPVNGYANSWYIDPEDVDEKTDYTLIIEMTSQKLFYVSLFVSLIGLVFVIFLFIKSFKK